MDLDERSKRPGVPEGFVDASLALIEREGWDHASLERLASNAGLDLAVVLSAYPSRELFAARVLERMFDALPHEFADEVDVASDLRARLHAVIAHELRAMSRYKRFMAAVLVDVLNPFSHMALAQLPTMVRYLAFVAEQIEVARSRAEISRFVIPTAAAAAFWVVHLRIVAFWLADDSVDSEASFALADRLITGFVRVLGGSSQPPTGWMRS